MAKRPNGTTSLSPSIRELCSLPEASELLGVSRTTVFALIKRGDLQRVKIGARTFISRDSIDGFVHRLIQEESHA